MIPFFSPGALVSKATEGNWVPRNAAVRDEGFPPVHDRLLTTHQVADYLGFSPETVLRWERQRVREGRA